MIQSVHYTSPDHLYEKQLRSHSFVLLIAGLFQIQNALKCVRWDASRGESTLTRKCQIGYLKR